MEPHIPMILTANEIAVIHMALARLTPAEVEKHIKILASIQEKTVVACKAFNVVMQERTGEAKPDASSAA